LSITRSGAGGTTTSLLALTQSGGTATDGILFTGTIGTDITTATNRALTIDTAGTGTITLGGGTGIKTINLATGGTGAKTVTLGSTASTSSTTINSGTGNIDIGTTAQARSINLGTAAAVQTVVLGSTNSTSSITIQSGTGAINIGATAQARTTNVATGAAVQTLVLGSTNTTSSTTIQSGSAGITMTGDITATGNAVFRPASDSASAFVVQEAGGEAYLTVDTESATDALSVKIGAGTDHVLFVLDSIPAASEPTGIAGAMYYDSTNNKFRCYTTTWVDCDTTGGGGATRRVTLSPEYGGGTLRGDGSNNSGTMLADYDATARRVYYNWVSSTSTPLQDYDIVISTTIPSDYASGLTGWNIWTWADSTSTSNNDINVQVLDASGTSCHNASLLPGSATTWVEAGFSLSGCSFAANDTITIIIKVSSLNNNDVRVGPIRFQYTN